MFSNAQPTVAAGTKRRSLAARCGADMVVDPAEVSPYEASRDERHLNDAPAAFELAISTIEKRRFS